MRKAILTFAALLPLVAAGAQTPQAKPPSSGPVQPAKSQSVKETPPQPSSAKSAAQGAKETPPPPAPIRPFQFPKVDSRQLPNGLTVYVIEDHRLPVVSYRMEIASAGSSANELKKAGLASMTAQLLRQGTKTRNAQQIATIIDRVGGSLSTDATVDSATIRSTVTKSSAPVALELMADVVTNPTFPQEEIDRLSRQTLSGLQIQYSDPQGLAQLVGPRVVYGSHPYANPVNGTPETIRAIKRDDIAGFYQKNYGPAAAYLAIAGDVTAAEGFAAAEKAFGPWKGSAVAPKIPAPQPTSARRIVVIDKPDAVQTQIRLSEVAVRRADPDFIPLLVANQIFGGDFNSRLNMKLRAAEGLTYGANSGFNALAHAGSFNVSTFTRTEKTGTAVKMMADLLTELLNNPITDQELNEAKAYLAGSFVLSIETPEAVAARALSAALNGLPADYWQTYRERITAVTKDQVVAAIKKHITPNTMNIVAVGNAGQFVKELEPLGKVQVIPASDLDVTTPEMVRTKEAAPVSAESKARGMELVRQAAEAIGGKTALDNVKTLRTKGAMTISMGGQNMKLETEQMVIYPDHFRLNITTPMGQMVQAFDGKAGWIQQGPQTRDMPPGAAKEIAAGIARAGAIGLLRAAMSGQAEVSAMDPVDMDGKKLNVAMWTQGDNRIKLFFDPESKRIARMAYRGVAMQGPADLDVIMSDYRKVGDVMLPYSEVVLQNGQKFAESITAEAQINTELKPELFAKPAA